MSPFRGGQSAAPCPHRLGPPGVDTINTKHHRAGRLELDGDELIVNGHASEIGGRDGQVVIPSRHVPTVVTTMS